MAFMFFKVCLIQKQPTLKSILCWKKFGMGQILDYDEARSLNFNKQFGDRNAYEISPWIHSSCELWKKHKITY